tara:strand:+ start:1407 stop:2561 length:1155 start_codon:yes stop_codon:yes gene_type:complete
MKVGLIGVGRCGLPIALNFEQRGLQVIASSYKQEYIEDLQNKIINTTEPYVKELLQDSKIDFTTDNQRVIEECDVIYILVATPSLPSGDYDMQAIDNVMDDFKKYKGSLKDKVCVIASTTNPGYCETVNKSMKDIGLDIAYCPIFIAQGSVYKDFDSSHHVMIGTDNENAFTKTKALFLALNKPDQRIFNMGFTASEILKMTYNCFYTIKVSFVNQIGQLLYRSGSWKDKETFYELVRIDDVIGARASKFGFGYGGPCLPRDNKSLVKFAKKLGVDYNIGDVVDDLNNKHVIFLHELYSKQNQPKLPYYFSYISYKPGTDLDEPAQQHDLAKLFLEDGIKVYVSPSQFLNQNVAKKLKDQFGDLFQIKSETDLKQENIDYFQIN